MDEDKQLSPTVMQMQKIFLNSIKKLVNANASGTQVAIQDNTIQIFPTFDIISGCNIDIIAHSNANIVNDMHIASRVWCYSIDSSSIQPPTTRLDY